MKQILHAYFPRAIFVYLILLFRWSSAINCKGAENLRRCRCSMKANNAVFNVLIMISAIKQRIWRNYCISRTQVCCSCTWKLTIYRFHNKHAILLFIAPIMIVNEDTEMNDGAKISWVQQAIEFLTLKIIIVALWKNASILWVEWDQQYQSS